MAKRKGRQVEERCRGHGQEARSEGEPAPACEAQDDRGAPLPAPVQAALQGQREAFREKFGRYPPDNEFA